MLTERTVHKSDINRTCSI